MRTEKSPLRMACSACSRSSDGLVLPLPEGLGLPARRVTDGVAEPRSLMKVPLGAGAPESGLRASSNRVRSRRSSWNTGKLVPPAGTAPKQPKVPLANWFHGLRKKVPGRFPRSSFPDAPFARTRNPEVGFVDSGFAAATRFADPGRRP